MGAVGEDAVDRFMAAVEIAIRATEAAKPESVWDGFCGLVPICDETEFKEWGVVRPLHKGLDVSPPLTSQPASPEHRPAGGVQAAHGARTEAEHGAAVHQQEQQEAAQGGTLRAADDCAAAAVSLCHPDAAAPLPPQQEQQQEQAQAQPSAGGSDDDGSDMPVWVVGYVLAASASGTDADSKASKSSVSSSDASTALSSPSTGSLASEASTTSDVAMLPSPPKHPVPKRGPRRRP